MRFGFPVFPVILFLFLLHSYPSIFGLKWSYVVFATSLPLISVLLNKSYKSWLAVTLLVPGCFVVRRVPCVAVAVVVDLILTEKVKQAKHSFSSL